MKHRVKSCIHREYSDHSHQEAYKFGGGTQNINYNVQEEFHKTSINKEIAV